MPKRYSEGNMEITNVSLWGPSQAGKDWLIKAFIKELGMLSPESKNGFRYQIAEDVPSNNSIIIMAQPPQNNPTLKPEDIQYQFERRAIPNDSKKHRITEDVSKHKLIIHNDAGGNWAGCLDKSESLETTYHNLVNTQNLILVLGPPSESIHSPENTLENTISSEDNTAEIIRNSVEGGKEYPENNSFSESPDWNKDDYVSFLSILFTALNEKKYNIAICMTKLDLDDYRGNPQDIFIKRYGLELMNLVRTQSQHQIKIFATSAVGYLDGHERNFANNAIKDPNRWKPIGTVYPFFWIFEKIERIKLQSSGSFFYNPEKYYIPYPDNFSY